MKRTTLSSMLLAPALLIAALVAPGAAAAAGPITTASSCTGTGTVTCDLWAKPGTLPLPGTSVTAWGYSTTSVGSPTFPGPAIVVNQGDTVTVNLTNNLTQPTSLVFDGVAGPPDLAAVAPGASHPYTFTATTPGTYLYEAGILPGSEYQVSMGLYGVLIVRPTGAPGQAYADASTAFGDEALVILGEVDPALSNSASPQGFDLRKFAPKYFLVNGTAYQNTPASTIPVTSGNTLLLRYANAGIQHHSIGVLGLHQRVLAADGSELPYPRTMVAETIAPGQSADVLVSLPATTAASTLYPIYDASLSLNNSAGSGIGGMLALLESTGTAGGDTVGPLTSSVTVTQTAPGSGLYTLTATVSDASTGGANVAAAEYRIDSTSATPTALAAVLPPFDAVSEDVTSATGEIDTSTWTSGTHTVYVRGQDALLNWGSNASVTIVLDKTGPTTSAVVLNPSRANGSANVALSATASDSASGGSNVTAAEYTIDGGAAAPMNLNTISPTVSLTASIPAATVNALPDGPHTVSVRSQDAAGNWGGPATATLTVDKTGPATSAIGANPGANNGSNGQSTSNPSVRVTATFDDTGPGNGSNIAAGEGFIDTVGANGTGFPFAATVGTFDTATETGYADIPLATINLLSSGNHTIYVHGKDSAGNWGVTSSITYLIDRTAPTFIGITLAPNPTLGAATITLTVNGALDPLVGGLASGVTGGAYWIDTAAPAPGGGTLFSGLTASIPTASLTTGNHTIGARIRDAAGNWSTTTASATVLVVPDAIFANGFETGTTPWGWSSASTTSATRMTVTTSPALVGTRSLQVQGGNTNYVQYNFGTAAQPATATYDARFYFRPGTNNSTGKDILAAATSNTFGTTLFHVRYRLSGAQPQVQIQVGATANASWVNVLGGTSNNVIEVVWQSGTTLRLYVNGTLSQTLTAATGNVGAVRLGSVTATGNAALMYFDAFASKRSTSPLVGP